MKPRSPRRREWISAARTSADTGMSPSPLIPYRADCARPPGGIAFARTPGMTTRQLRDHAHGAGQRRAGTSVRLPPGATALLRALIAWLLALSAVLFVPPALAQALQPVPALTARVIDRSGTLSAPQQQALEDKLAA